MRPNQTSSLTRTTYAAGLTVLLVLLGRLPTGASCFCYPPPPGRYLEACDVVFAAKFLGLYADTALHDTYGAAPLVYQFRVRRYWLGLHPHTERLSLTFAPECKPRGLREGTEYLVYLQGARESKNVSSLELPAISMCDSLVELAGARKNLVALDSAFGPGTVPTPAPGTSEASISPADGFPPGAATTTPGGNPPDAPVGYPWQATTWLLAALSAGLLVRLVWRERAKPAS